MFGVSKKKAVCDSETKAGNGRRGWRRAAVCIGLTACSILAASSVSASWGEDYTDEERHELFAAFDTNGEIEEVVHDGDLDVVIMKDGTAGIAYYNGDLEKLTRLEIPSEVQGHPVEEIRNMAFEHVSTLEEIVFPDTLVRIGEDSFEFNYGLKKLVFPEGLKIIDEGAFNCCRDLEEIVLPESLEELRSDSFNDCDAMKEVTVPSKIKDLVCVFSFCDELQKVTLPEGVEYLVNEFTSCPALEEINIPDSVQVISNGSFADCTSLKELTIPEKTEISDGAFKDCTNLTLFVKAGSPAEEYCKDHADQYGFSYQTVG